MLGTGDTVVNKNRSLPIRELQKSKQERIIQCGECYDQAENIMLCCKKPWAWQKVVSG